MEVRGKKGGWEGRRKGGTEGEKKKGEEKGREGGRIEGVGKILELSCTCMIT